MPTNRLEQLKTLLNESPEDAFLQFAIAKEYEKLGQAEEALQCYLDLAEGHPGYVGTYYHLGKLQEKLGSGKLAWETYSKGMAIARQAGDQHALSELAGARLALGDEEDFVGG